MRFTYTIITGVFLFVYACSSEEKKSASVCPKPGTVTNPNGMSEMSQIMEDWYAEMKRVGDSIRAGKLVRDIKVFDEKKVLTAKTTKTDLKKEQFGAFNEAFFYNYNNMRKATEGYEQASSFNLTVTACLNCHEQYCHGPTVRIKKLTIADI